MKKQWLIVLSLTAGLSLSAAVGVAFHSATAEVPPVDYYVRGASVRLADDVHDSGVKFHVVMEKEKYDSLTENGELQTGTLIIPQYLLGESSLTVDTREVMNIDTTGAWSEITLDDILYMESVAYVYDIPVQNYGSELVAVGYYKETEETDYIYTQEISGVSMSWVAKAEYDDENSELTSEEKDSLKETYLDFSVSYHVDNTETTRETAEYGEKLSIPNEPEKEGYDFIGWFNKDGKTEWNFDSDTVKGNIHLYAKFEESYIPISSADEFMAVTDWSKNYQLTADLDFSEYIEDNAYTSRGTLSGVLDGNGHCIKNLVIPATNGAQGTSDNALFWSVSGTLKNLAIYAQVGIGNVPVEYSAVVAREIGGGSENAVITNLYVEAVFCIISGEAAVNGYGVICGVMNYNAFLSNTVIRVALVIADWGTGTAVGNYTAPHNKKIAAFCALNWGNNGFERFTNLYVASGVGVSGRSYIEPRVKTDGGDYVTNNVTIKQVDSDANLNEYKGDIASADWVPEFIKNIVANGSTLLIAQNGVKTW